LSQCECEDYGNQEICDGVVQVGVHKVATPSLHQVEKCWPCAQKAQSCYHQCYGPSFVLYDVHLCGDPKKKNKNRNPTKLLEDTSCCCSAKLLVNSDSPAPLTKPSSKISSIHSISFRAVAVYISFNNMSKTQAAGQDPAFFLQLNTEAASSFPKLHCGTGIITLVLNLL